MSHNHTPIGPLRMRIFSELNLELSHHGIEKETMHETSSLSPLSFLPPPSSPLLLLLFPPAPSLLTQYLCWIH